MPTRNADIEQADNWVLIATGPQPVTINYKKGVGEYAVELTGTPPPEDGHWVGQQPVSMALGDGEQLHVNGHGRLVATADVLAI